MPVDNVDEDNERSKSAASQRLQAHEVSVEEYNEPAKRPDTMETSVGSVLAKVQTDSFRALFVSIPF